jgi:hypothetical protein
MCFLQNFAPIYLRPMGANQLSNIAQPRQPRPKMIGRMDTKVKQRIFQAEGQNLSLIQINRL